MAYEDELMHADWLKWFEAVRNSIQNIGTISAGTANGAFVMNGVANASFPNAQPLGALSTGLVKNTTTTGILTIAVPATDYVAPSAYASANGLTMATARLLGRTTAGSGAAEEISVAGLLTLSGGVLTGGSPAGAALTRTDDTNVTATLTGTPATALLQAVNVALGWTGTLAAARLNANVVQAVTNDTNVTGSIAAQVLTLGWTGTLAVARGGIGIGTLASNGVLYGNGTGAVQTLTVNATATKKFLTQTSSAAPAWDTIAVSDVPTLNQDTTGSAAKWTTARLLAGNSVDGSANVAFANKFIVQGTTDAGLSAAQFLGALATGLVKNTTTTGVLSIGAAATDYVAPSAYASANGLTMSTARLLGRTTASSGAAEEISIAGNLTLSAGVLTSPAYTGTANQVIVTGNVLSTPQNIGTGSSPQFATIGLSTAAVANHFIEESASLNGVLVGLKETNSSNGASAFASIQLFNDTGNIFAFFLNSSGNTSYGGAQGVTFDQVGNFNLSFATQDTVRWGINGAGDWTFGASAHIADSNGTPSIASGGGTGPSIAGTDYAFRVTVGTTPGATDIVVNFGHTFSNAPIVMTNYDGPGGISPVPVRVVHVAAVSTTSITLRIIPDTVNWVAGDHIDVLARGY
jgi:hypothetical protein